jgi:HEAT repeat protein
VKANAALALFAAGHYEVLSMLKPMLLHSDPLMRSSAAFAIGELPQVANKERIVEAFRKDERRFKWYLAQLQECVPLLVSLLRDSELMVKKQAVLALGKIRDRSAVLPILEAVQTQGEAKEYLRAASDALREIGAHRVIRDVVDRMSS